MGSREFVNRLGAELLARQVTEEPHRNALCSPVGVAALISLLHPEAGVGLDAETREALRRFDPDPDLLRDLDPDQPPETPLLHLADHVMLIDDTEPLPGYMAALDDRATISRAPLAEARTRLDAWAALHTGKLIEQTAVVVDEQTRIVLQNALLVAAGWDRELTLLSDGAPFHRADGTTSTVTCMGAQTDRRFVRRRGWQAVRLDHRCGGLACDLILPRQRISPVELPPGTWAAATEALTVAEPTPVRLRMPRLDLSSGPVPLNPLLEELGVPPGLDHVAPGLPAVQVAQQVRVTVTERGVVAAALTEHWMSASLLATDPVPFVVDRPFVLRLVDLEAGVPLVEAVVMDPAE
ncbi:MAG: serpin family protein [Arachnia propionica]|uniref:serpin family protein n=1 Tax=Arachnia propionica TaxID=1750 RepID=UPI00270B6418|nr:serpin family protein [Arachnia propionica]